MRILLSGGGTGGHVYPILAVVDALVRMIKEATIDLGGKATRPVGAAQPLTGQLLQSGGLALRRTARGEGESAAPTGDGIAFRFIGEDGGIEAALAARAGIAFSSIATGQIRGRDPASMVRNLAKMACGATQSRAILREFQPDVVFLTGGYVAAPVAWAAWRARVPILIYLPDLVPGQAILLTSRLAARVAVSFPEVAAYFPGKAVVTGYPVRSELLSRDRASARTALGLRQDAPVLLVFGGSRGARSINRALVTALPDLLPRCQIVHVSGELDWPWVAEAAASLKAGLRTRYHPHAYLHQEMALALAAADLAIARAGASTLGEFPACGLASILVPYPYAGQHQDANAAYLAERGAALVIPDVQLAERLAPTVLQLLDNPAELAAMAQAATNLARPEAAENLAWELCHLAGY